MDVLHLIIEFSLYVKLLFPAFVTIICISSVILSHYSYINSEGHNTVWVIIVIWIDYLTGGRV